MTVMICVAVAGLYAGPIYVTRSVQHRPDRRRDHP